VISSVLCVNLNKFRLRANTLLPIYNFQCLYVQPNINEVSLRYMLNTDVERVVICVKKITTVVTSLSSCLEFKICNSGFHVCNSTCNGV